MQQLFYYVREIAINDADSEVYFPLVEKKLSYIRQVQDGVLFGNLSMPFPSFYAPNYYEVDKNVGRLLYEDGCVSRLHDSLLYAQCRAFSLGVLKSGLYPALLAFEDMAHLVALAGNSTEDLSAYKLFEELALVYILPITDDYAHNILTALSQNTARLLRYLDYAFGVGFCLVLISYSTSYSPARRKLKDLVRHNDALPLLVPFFVAADCSAVQDFIFYGKRLSSKKRKGGSHNSGGSSSQESLGSFGSSERSSR